VVFRYKVTGANLGRKQCRVGAVKISQIPAGAGWEWTKISTGAGLW